MSGNQQKITWYTCGPTVYNHSHLGHARNYIMTDILKRIMRDYMGYDINFAMNITDVDDKIINKSNAEKVEFTEIARKFEDSFFEDMKSLNVELPDGIVRVSEFIPEIIAYIEQIINNGFAYAANGSVYFDVTEFQKDHKYPQLEPTNAKNMQLLQEGEGVLSSVDNTDKKTQFDFALWKKSKEGEPSWDSPWGPGRPGWHIECSAMI